MTLAPLCWGARVDRPFRDSVRRIGARLGFEPDWLMACMGFETGRTFSPSIRNAAGSGATGLIQFVESTAAALGTSTVALALMGSLEQLVFVEAYFRPWKGRLKSLEDVYSAILFPAAIGKPKNWVLFRESDPNHPKRYIQNAGLDFNQDGVITKAEATARVSRLLVEGLRPENSRV